MSAFPHATPAKRLSFRYSSWAIAFAALMTLLSGVAALAAPSTQQASTKQVFIPFISAGGSSRQPDQEPPPPDTLSGLFLTRDIKTSSADIAVDAAGGIHVAYAGYVGYGTLSPSYYAYCPASATCSNPASWTILTFGSGKDYITKAEIQLTAAGQPRLLLYNEYDNRIYTYAACDASCTNRASWTTTNVGAVQSYIDMDMFDYSYHTFALDPQGRPRFIYEDHYGSIHNGLYYRYCDADCTNAASWHELNISAGPDYDGDRAQTPNLTFTSQGQPRIITQLYSRNEQYPAGVYYISCDQQCADLASWQRTRLFDRGNGHASWTLALDAQDRPRVAFYQGETEDGNGNQLSYVWCDSNCTTAANWSKTLVGLAQNNGQSPALVLDSQGHPRIAIAIKQDQGIGYLWCNSQCDTAAQWHAQVAEPLDALNADFPRPAPFGCDVTTWLGARPQLALDPQGNPRIGYDGEYLIGNTAVCTPTIEYRSARFTFFAQP